MVKDDLIQDLVDFTKLDNYKEFDLFTSCEATGLQADYIRDGLEYNTWKDNLEYVISNGRLRCATIMMTITSLSLFSITEFLDDMAELKAKYAPHKPAVDLNILRWPSFMSPLALPDHIKDHCREQLENWFEKNKNNPLFNSGEKAQIQRLIDYIEVVDKPHRRTTEDKDKLQHDFKSFYAQYDKRRGKDIGVFPKILTDWLNTIGLDDTIPLIEMHEGSITHYDD